MGTRLYTYNMHIHSFLLNNGRKLLVNKYGAPFVPKLLYFAVFIYAVQDI